MFHLVARTRGRAPLWRTWSEGCALWNRVLRCTHGRTALVLMPDHLHLVHPNDVRLALAQAVAGHVRSVGGVRLESLPAAQPLADRVKVKRAIRYVHLNPCRSGLCRDPLAWPLSTHRDACGLMVSPAVPPRKNPAAFHRYVSADPTVAVEGTALPQVENRVFRPEEVLVAVSAVTRTPMHQLKRRGSARSLYCVAARELTAASPARIGLPVNLHRSAVYRATAHPQHVHCVRRVLGDRRFTALHDRDLSPYIPETS